MVSSDATANKSMGDAASAQTSCNPGDYTTNFFFSNPENAKHVSQMPINGGGNPVASGDQPNGWSVTFEIGGFPERLIVICQTPVTVAGLGVPEFGSLYAVLALGAVAYFMLSRRLTRRQTLSAQA